MSPIAVTLLTNLAMVTGLMVSLWMFATSRRDVSVVDLFWGTGFAFVACCSALVNPPANWRIGLLAALTCVWGLRLSLHLWRRNHGRPEDRRYAAMRAHHGNRFWWVSLLTVFLLQGGLLWFIALPLQVAAAGNSPAMWNWLDLLGGALWLIGFVFESVGDRQLARFKADSMNAGRVLDRGLWRYTRHPNYFGDCCVWWGLYLIAASAGAGWTIASPVLMTFLLLKVSGVSLLESDIAERRPDYAAYQARTNAFFPGPPRSASG